MTRTGTQAAKGPKDKNWRPRISSGFPSHNRISSLTSTSAAGAEFATVIVGKEKKRFVVHQDLLIYYSKFFCNALTKGFKESGDKVVKLEEDSEEIFELFVHWLYYERLPDPDLGDNEGIVGIWAEDEDTRDRAVELYIFAHVYMIEKLETDTMRFLFNHMIESEAMFMPENIHHAFNRLPKDSPLCQFMIDLECTNSITPMDLEQNDLTNITFLQGIWLHYASLYKEDASLEPCDYLNEDYEI